MNKLPDLLILGKQEQGKPMIIPGIKHGAGAKKRRAITLPCIARVCKHK